MEERFVFIYDYFKVMLELGVRNQRNIPDVLAFAGGLLVIKWGYTYAEIEEARNAFLDQINTTSFDDFPKVVVPRLLEYVNKSYRLRTEFVSNFIVMAEASTRKVNTDIAELIHGYGELLGLKHSEFESICDRAVDIEVILNVIADRNCKTVFAM